MPRPAAPAKHAFTPPMQTDRVTRPIPEPSPGQPTRTPPGPYDALPVFAAAALIAGGAVVAMPTFEAAAVGLGDGAAGVAPALSRGGEFAKTAVRHFAAEYRAAAGKVADVKLTDPAALGKALGAQGWTATEELCRSGVVGAGLAGGAWAAHTITAAAQRALAQMHTRATTR